MKSVRVRHILVKHQFEAQDIQRNLGDGKDFSALAKKHSLCPSAPGGGDLGPVKLERLDEDFAQACQGLKEFEVSSPVRTRFGWHLIQKLHF